MPLLSTPAQVFTWLNPALPTTLAGYGILDAAPVVHTHAAADLTGATLAPGVLASSLTSLGTLGSLAVTGAAPLFTRDALAAVSTDGLVLQNTTAATAGVPVQQSPRLRFRSHVWDTSPGETQTNDFWLESIPVSGGTPSGAIRFGSSVNGAAATYPAVIDSGGGLTLLGSLTAGVVFAQANVLFGAGLSRASSPANGQLNFTNTALALGIGLDFATDAVLKIRTRAQTGYATVDALGYRASGVAGISFGPAPPASITIVNGIVTACS